MRSFFTFAAVIALLPVVLAAPTELKAVSRTSGAKKANSYIVTLKDGAERTPLVKKLKGSARTTIYDKALLNAFAAEVDEEDLNTIRADPNVARIEEDAILSISATQTNAPWGLQRISQDGRVSGNVGDLSFTYTYSTTGAGVDVYVVDTGINTAHTDFGGRARWGATFGGYEDADNNGHGTHCAGTVGGTQYGVSKDVSLIAVKVLGDDGSGSFSDIISGLNWVLVQARTSGRPSVVSMSLGGTSPLVTVDMTVESLTAAGIHVVVAAGNESQNVANVTPARAPSAITVAASDINDTFASFSNYGAGVDIIAPGVKVISTYKGSNTATATLSGTSMATPHVAGLVAYFICKEGNVSPAVMASKLTSYSVSGAISGVPSDTVNRLANNEF